MGERGRQLVIDWLRQGFDGWMDGWRVLMG